MPETPARMGRAAAMTEQRSFPITGAAVPFSASPPEWKPPKARKPRPILPKGEVIFRAVVLCLLAGIAFVIPVKGAWWAGLFLAYMAANIIVNKLLQSVSDRAYNWLRGRWHARRS
jgi:hypothetical protein